MRAKLSGAIGLGYAGPIAAQMCGWSGSLKIPARKQWIHPSGFAGRHGSVPLWSDKHFRENKPSIDNLRL